MANALSDKERALMDAYWRAANYLSVGQIYLYDNPLLKQSLTKEHIKPRLLGHWGTTPGLNFIYVHLNRLIRESAALLDVPAAKGAGVRFDPDPAAPYIQADTAQVRQVLVNLVMNAGEAVGESGGKVVVIP